MKNAIFKRSTAKEKESAILRTSDFDRKLILIIDLITIGH